MSHFVLIKYSFLIFLMQGSHTHYWSKFSNYLLLFKFENSFRYHKCYFFFFLLLFDFLISIFEVRMCDGIWLVRAQLFINKSTENQQKNNNQSTSSKCGGFKVLLEQKWQKFLLNYVQSKIIKVYQKVISFCLALSSSYI